MGRQQGAPPAEAISGNIGSYAADSMVRRCGPPTPPPARAADSDTGDPGTVRPGVPVYDKRVSRATPECSSPCFVLWGGRPRSARPPDRIISRSTKC